MNRPPCFGRYDDHPTMYVTRKCKDCPYISDCGKRTAMFDAVHQRAKGEYVEQTKEEREKMILDTYHTLNKQGAEKKDNDKPTPELLPFAALVEVSEVLAHGARKYAPHNWRKGMVWSRLLGAALRHLFAWGAGENKDPETGRSHLAHAAACVLFLLDYEMTGGYGHLDDRAKGKRDA